MKGTGLSVLESNEGIKNMKNKSNILLGLFAILFLLGTSAGAQQPLPDLSMRMALYFTGTKADKIDLATDKFVVAGATMQLKKSQGKNCDDNGCTFNIGFIATRSGYTRGELSTYGLFTVEGVEMVGNTVFFGWPDKSKQGVHALKLKMGMNKVTFTIDPYQKTAETDENNNSFSASFNVISDTLPPIRKVPPPIKD